MEALSGDVEALGDDVAVKCMLGTACCLLQEGDKSLSSERTP